MAASTPAPAAARPTASPAASPVGWFARPTPIPVSEIVIGALYPFSGRTAINADAIRVALDTVAGIANVPTAGLPWPWAAGAGLPALGGAIVRLVAVDHGGVPENGQAEAERLVAEENVHALIGCVDNSVTTAVARVAEHAAIPFLVPEAPSSTLTTHGQQWLFRTCPHDGQVTAGSFDFLADLSQRAGLAVKTVGLTYEDTLTGAESARLHKEQAVKHGYQVVADIKYRPRARSLLDEVEQLHEADPDVWLATSSGADLTRFVRTARERGFRPRLLLVRQVDGVGPAYLTATGPDVEGAFVPAPFLLDLAPHRPLLRNMNDLYRRNGTAANGQPRDLGDLSARTLVGGLVLIDAIQRAGTVEPKAIRRALQETSIPADWVPVPWTGVAFDGSGQNVRALVPMAQLQSGTLATIWPWGLAARDVAVAGAGTRQGR
ncbi:MAG: ABC transporter substrate-binding protein [Chloroflexi bacterium]|nr:ABC transporter substrate-binding protein [Chloroflexota bacterium]